LDDRLVILYTAQTKKFQPGAARLGFKILAGNQHNAEATFSQVVPNPNKWIDIAGAANGAEEDDAFRSFVHTITKVTSDFSNECYNGCLSSFAFDATSILILVGFIPNSQRVTFQRRTSS
jgi:hypothetical protein